MSLRVSSHPEEILAAFDTNTSAVDGALRNSFVIAENSFIPSYNP